MKYADSATLLSTLFLEVSTRSKYFLASSLLLIWSWLAFAKFTAFAPKFAVNHDLAAEWQDDLYPYREQTPWDISTDFSYSRLLEYDVQEGTWLRLDVHPKTGDVVFDMVGDIYCFPASEAYAPNRNVSTLTARPILKGIPYDTEPRFSPDGNRLLFRSDAELGIENIWIMKWTGCESMDLRQSEVASDSHSVLAQAPEEREYENLLLSRGVRENIGRKENRLVREGRSKGMRSIRGTNPLRLLT